jgi:RND family efflux transporter MFP subunit
MRTTLPPFLLLSVLIGAGCHGDKAPEAAGTDADVPAVVGAQTATATEGAFTEMVTAIGTVVPRPGRYAEMSAPGPTRVARIFVAPGDPVRAGQPLVEFERAPFDAAAQSADVALTNAEHAAERAHRLADAGILARKDADQAEADLAQARSNAVTARRAQELATLKAPIAGVVTRMTAVMGAAVDPTQVMVAVADPAALDLAFSLSPADGALIKPGAAITVSAGPATHGDPLGTGTVTTIGAAIDSSSRGITVRARMTRAARALRIGETVFGQVAIAVHPHAVMVPIQALVPDGEGDGLKVFVVDHGLAHARAVTVGGRNEKVAEITDGLHVGEVVVTEGAYGVDDSAKVVPMTAGAKS